MSDEVEHYSRQVRLREVGPEGQARIARSELEVDASAVGTVEATYLRRAGVGRLHTVPSKPFAFAHAHLFAHDASRRFASGAWRALGQLRSVLDIQD